MLAPTITNTQFVAKGLSEMSACKLEPANNTQTKAASETADPMWIV